MAAFRWSYALFQIPGGWFGDRIGPRRALTLIVTWWSLFTSATAMAWNAASMLAIRFLFGIGEAGAFPIATRSLSRWMLPDERGFAQGITHAGSRLGAALTPPLVVVSDLALRLAPHVRHLRDPRARLGCGMVLLLSRHAGRTHGRQCRRNAG